MDSVVTINNSKMSSMGSLPVEMESNRAISPETINNQPADEESHDLIRNDDTQELASSLETQQCPETNTPLLETTTSSDKPDSSTQDASSNTAMSYQSIESNIEVVTIPIDIGFGSTAEERQRQHGDLPSDINPSHSLPQSDYSSPTDNSFSLCYENDSVSVTSTIAQDLDLDNDGDSDVPSKLFMGCTLDTDNDIEIMERLEADMMKGVIDTDDDLQDMNLVDSEVLDSAENENGSIPRVCNGDKDGSLKLSLLVDKDQLPIDGQLTDTLLDSAALDDAVKRSAPHNSMRPLSPIISLERSPHKLLTDKCAVLAAETAVVNSSEVEQKSAKARKKLSVERPTKPMTRSLTSLKLRNSVRSRRWQTDKEKMDKEELSPRQTPQVLGRKETPKGKKSLETTGMQEKKKSEQLNSSRKRKGKRKRVFTRKSRKATPYAARSRPVEHVAPSVSPMNTLTEEPAEENEKQGMSTRKRKRADVDSWSEDVKRSRNALSDPPTEEQDQPQTPQTEEQYQPQTPQTEEQDQPQTPQTEKRYNTRGRRTITSVLAKRSVQSSQSSEQKTNQSSQSNQTDQSNESKTPNSQTGSTEGTASEEGGGGGDGKKQVRVPKRRLSGGQKSNESSSSPVKKWKCEFCGLGNDMKDLGYLYGPYRVKDVSLEEQEPDETAKEDTKGAGKEKERRDVWVHAACVYWSPGVCLVGDEVMGLDEAISTGARSHCHSCSNIGAVLCCEVRTCRLCYHYPCAVEQGCSFHAEKFNITCPKHIVKETTPPPQSPTVSVD